MSLLRIRGFIGASIFTVMAPLMIATSWENCCRAFKLEKEPLQFALGEFKTEVPPDNYYLELVDWEFIDLTGVRSEYASTSNLYLPLKAKGCEKYAIFYAPRIRLPFQYTQWFKTQPTIKGVLMEEPLPAEVEQQFRERYGEIDLDNVLVLESISRNAIVEDAQTTGWISLMCVGMGAFCWYIALKR